MTAVNIIRSLPKGATTCEAATGSVRMVVKALLIFLASLELSLAWENSQDSKQALCYIQPSHHLYVMLWP